jgi:purine-binding chemotaxis protein CheW
MRELREGGVGERSARILEERARALARPLAPPTWGTAIEAITFALGKERYALESRYLQAVFRLQRFSPIPGAAPPIVGVTAWRGDLLTILDLRQLLGVQASGVSDQSRVLVLGEARAAFGILADAVAELVTLPLSAIRPPAEGVAMRREYLRGITGTALLVLDAAHLLKLHG